MIWLIEENAGRALSDARGSVGSFSVEQIRDFEARAAAEAGASRNVSKVGSTMEIRVEGILTERPDMLAAWFGGGNTLYSSIVEGLSRAAADPSVREVVFAVNSPGGTVDGLFDALGAIESFKASSGKKVRTVAGKALSAAYAIAAAAGPITARNASSMFGSVGTAIDFTVFSGAKTVSITNTDSPAKRPDPTTEDGKAEIVKLLDSLNGIFVDAIARGRGVAREIVTKDYGRGATLIASEAKRRGMVDAIAKPASFAASSQRASARAALANHGPMTARVLELVAEMRSGCTSAGARPGRYLGDITNADLMGAADGDDDASSTAYHAPQAASRGHGDGRAGADLGDRVAALLCGEDAGQMPAAMPYAPQHAASHRHASGDLGDAVAAALLAELAVRDDDDQTAHEGLS